MLYKDSTRIKVDMAGRSGSVGLSPNVERNGGLGIVLPASVGGY